MKINLQEKFGKFSENWHPFIIGELNDNHVKIAKLKGEFIWHSHDDEDELFVVLSGTLVMEYRGRTEEVSAGEIIIVPKGIEHCPRTKNDEEVKVMLVEQKSIKHTGNIKSDRTVEKPEWI